MSFPDDNQMNRSFTLGQLLAHGPLPLPDALRSAGMLAEAIRQIHDSGRTCGALLPSNIAITDTGLELIDEPDQPAAITPYTAPEVLQGHTPDSRSDIFAFGAIVYEMITGRPAFAGDNADALAVSLTISGPPPTGTPAIDHLVSNCIAKDPAVRCQRMQKVILELKVLTFAPHAEAATRQQTVTAALRAETHQLEARVAALLDTHEKAISDVQQSSGDAISALRGRLSKVEAELGPVQARATLVEELCHRIMGHVEQVQQNIEAIDERVTGLKDGIDALSEGATVLREYLGTRMHEFEQTLKSQRTALASIVASQEQTDDVVEGVVGAMELLHTIVFDRAEGMRRVEPNGIVRSGVDCQVGQASLRPWICQLATVRSRDRSESAVLTEVELLPDPVQSHPVGMIAGRLTDSLDRLEVRLAAQGKGLVVHGKKELRACVLRHLPGLLGVAVGADPRVVRAHRHDGKIEGPRRL